MTHCHCPFLGGLRLHYRRAGHETLAAPVATIGDLVESFVESCGPFYFSAPRLWPKDNPNCRGECDA